MTFTREDRTSSVEVLLEALAADHTPHRRPIAVLATAIVAALASVGLSYLILDKFYGSRHSVVVHTVAAKAQPAPLSAAPAAVFNTPTHSIAVLPFVNISGD